MTYPRQALQEEEAGRREEAARFPLAQRLAEEAERNEVAVLLHFFTFREHLAAFLRTAADAGLGVIVLKGAALAETAYPRPGLRPFGDMDVLVRPSQTALARTVFESLGCAMNAALWDDFAGGRERQINFFRATERGQVVFELHTDLINNDLLADAIHVAPEGLWERARAVRLAGEDALVLGPEDQLLHLCVHLAGHYLAAPRSLRDIVQVCDAAPPDWDPFVALARRAGAAPACFAALSAAACLLGAPVPQAVRDALAPRLGAGRLERMAIRRASDLDGGTTENLRFPLLWGLLGGPGPRLRAALRVLFPSPRWLIAHYYFGLFDEAEWPGLPAGPRSLRAVLRQGRMLWLLYGAHLAFLGSRATSALRPRPTL